MLTLNLARCFSFFFTCILAQASSASSTSQADEWDGVRTLLDSWPKNPLAAGLMNNFCFSVGDVKQRRFDHAVGACTMQTQLALASASKMPAMTAVLGVVADSTYNLGLDDLVSKHLTYWTKDPSDARSAVTLRHLLSFTSGFFSNSAGGDVACVNGSPFISFDACVKQVYEKGAFIYKAGSTFDYNSYHLQIAGAVAEAASGLNINMILDKYLLGKLGMNHSSYGPVNPALAATLVTTGDDYDLFLRAYLGYQQTPLSLATEAERDYTASVQVSDKSQFLVDYIGHYGFAHWYECIYSPSFSSACQQARVHCDPGLFGYYPCVDRVNNYYFQIVYQGHVESLDDLRATNASMHLRQAVKPLLDAIMSVPHS